jgi:hypothetical protein
MSLYIQRFPIAEQIDCNIRATLEKVTTGYGFQINLCPATFPDPSGETPPADMKTVIFVGDDVKDSDADTPTGFTQWRRPYAIQVYIMKDAEALKDTRFETWKNVVRADVERALTADPYRGELAQNTEIGDPVTFEIADEPQGIFIVCEVTYRTIYENPYSANQAEI